MSYEIFAKPCVGAIIEKSISGIPHILFQTRQKPDGDETNGKLEIPAGKIREYEGILMLCGGKCGRKRGCGLPKSTGKKQLFPCIPVERRPLRWSRSV